ncbi:MAG: Flp pilus assembly complex ATPase component TadA [Phycisphaeraceae bacterium]|nr:Flp pilus assembly complex ATPase component TadA [Phycisphaerales bacterium]MCB9861555.1 Flp pilus assembly complex ATPase component TadA [Phycisphaeraceae bacterium]
MARSKKKLGDILVESGVLTADQAEKAVTMARGSRKRLGDVLVEAGFANEDQVAKGLAQQFGLEYMDLTKFDAGSVDKKLVPEDLIKRHTILPLEKNGNKLKLVIHDPMDLELMDMLRFRLNADVVPMLAPRSRIRDIIESMYGGGLASSGNKDDEAKPGDELVTASMDRTVDRSMDKSIDVASDDAPIVRLCNRLIAEACRMRTSDIHVEPMADRVRLRYRIDGVCIHRDDLPKRMQNALLSRLKLMAGMNIAERRVPQDGRIKLPVDGQTIDFRVSACPIYHGESVVLRILRPDSVKIGLEGLGFESENLSIFNKIIRRPNGIFLVTGPTGSGKTTTLYSALDVLNRPDKKIITAEDPVEYNFDGINQCQVHESIGFTFTAILRSMLRQAPNIILVGEIRDKEVADIAIQAALTGHLVFSTLHTNDAPSAITRLIDMGVKPFLVASAIQAIMAQRLVRVLCKECKEIDPDPDPKYLRITGITPEEAEGRVLRGVGCSKCGGVGFRGRQAIFEMMMMNQQIRELAFTKATVSELREAALTGGMTTLVQDGKKKVLKGVTTPSEVAHHAQVELADLAD